MSFYIELFCFRHEGQHQYYFDSYFNKINIDECLLLFDNWYVSPYQRFDKINIDFIKNILKNNKFENISKEINQFEILLSEEELFYLALSSEWEEYSKKGIIYEF